VSPVSVEKFQSVVYAMRVDKVVNSGDSVTNNQFSLKNSIVFCTPLYV